LERDTRPDLLERPRKSRIYYRGQLFAYPLRAFEVLAKLGAVESAAWHAVYVHARLAPVRAPRNFEDWSAIGSAGGCSGSSQDLHREGVGMKCTEISADWAAQRIKGFSLASAIRHALLGPGRRARATSSSPR